MRFLHRQDGMTFAPSAHALIYVLVALDFLGTGLVIPLVPLHVDALGGSAFFTGLMFMSFSLSQIVFGALLGRLSDRIGRKPIIVSSLLGNAAAMLVYAAALHRGALIWLLVSRILAGSTAANVATCQATIADVSSSETLPRRMAHLGAFLGGAMVLGPALAAQVSAYPIAAPLLAAVFALAAALLAVIGLQEPQRITQVSAIPPLAPSDKKRLLGVLALQLIVFWSLAQVQLALPLLATQRLHWSAREVGFLFTWFGTILVVTQSALVGWLDVKIGKAKLLRVGSALAACGLFALACAGNGVGVVGGIGLFALGFALTQPTLASLALATMPRRRGAVTSLLMSASGVARASGPLLAGGLFAFFGSAAPFYAGGALALLGTLIAPRR